MRIFTIFTPRQVLLESSDRGDEMDKENRGKCIQRFGEKISRNHSNRKIAVNKKIILKWILTKMRICGLN
jgi:hypothetical protein